MRKSQKMKNRIWGMLLAGVIFSLSMGETVFAVTNKSSCEQGGTVNVSYEIKGTKANGYGLKSGNILVTYDMGEPSEGCPNAGWQYVGITNQVQIPEIDASESNVSGGGYSCNGHTSNTAEWRHWFGRSGSILYGMDVNNIGTVVVTEEEYAKCSYAIAGPPKGLGDGIGADGMFYWIVRYKKLPTSISKEGVDEAAPMTSLQAAPAGRTAVNNANGKVYGTEALLTTNITDNQSRPHKSKTVRFKKGNEYITDWLSANSANKTETVSSFTIKENGTYYAQVQDQLGNADTSRGVIVDFIDREEPVALVGKEVNEKVLVGGKEWTATNVTIYVSATDAGVGLGQAPYCFDDVTWTGNDQYVVSQNGTYRIRIKDALGNVVTKSIFINNFDKQAPAAEIQTSYEEGIKIDEKEWSNKQLNLEIQAVDIGCGLDSQPYSYDGGVTWTSENKISFTENGEKIVKVRDSLHNTWTKQIFIDGIDKAAPEISEIQITAVENEEKGATVKVTASDNINGCGLHEMAYSFDGGKSWTDRNEITVSQTSILNIQVRDKLLNISTIMCPVKCTGNQIQKQDSKDAQESKKEDKQDTEKIEEDSKENETNQENQLEKEVKSDEGDVNGNEREGTDQRAATTISDMENNGLKNREIQTKQAKNKKNKQKQEEAQLETASDNGDLKNQNTLEDNNIQKETYRVEVPVLQDEKEPIIPKNYKKKTPLKRVLYVTISFGALFITAILFLLWYIRTVYKYKVVLYGRQDGSYKMLGKLKITKKEENLQIKIPEELLQQVTENFYKIEVNGVCIFSHEGEDIFLLVEDRIIKKQIEKQIDFYFE